MSGFVAALAVIVIAGTPDGRRFERFSFASMATRVEVTVGTADEAAIARRVVPAAFARVEERMNEWRPGTPLAAVNEAAGGAAVAVPDDVRAVLRRGLELGRLTGGAFDVTWAALWGLWDFRAPEPVVPGADAIQARIGLVGWARVELNEAAGTVRLPEAGMKVGLGGIAKGWALDAAAAALKVAGVASFMLSAGGQVLAAGGRGGRPWRVGIRDPRGGPEDGFAVISVADGSVSTSGDYERFFVRDGVRYHHVLDPGTGWPARGVRSATVVADDATTADALSTALMVLGVARGLALVEGLEGVEAVLVDDEARVHVSSGLGGRLGVKRRPRR